MATTTPTTKELAENIIAQLESTLGQTIPFLPNSAFWVLSRAMAGVYIVLYKYIGYGVLQGFVKTASAKPTTINGRTIIPLNELGELVGAGLPAPATQAQLTIDINVTNQVGTLDAGAQLVFGPTGVTYITESAVLLNAPIVTTNIRAVADQSGGNGSGAQGNIPDGQLIGFANPLPNVARDATVTGTIIQGANGESTEAYRQRVLDRFRKRPQGGALSDYELWGEEPAGIINVYPYRSDCPGQVDLYVEATPESSGSPDGFPTDAQLQLVLDSVELDENGLASRRPVGALANAFSITRVSFDVTVSGLSVDNLAEVQGQITTAVGEYIASRAPFIVGLDVPPRTDSVTQTALGGIVEAIVSSAGGTFISVALITGGVATLAYSLGIGEKAKLNSVTYL